MMKKILQSIRSFRIVQKIRAYAMAHKIISGIAVCAIVFVGYTVYGSVTGTTGETRFVTALSERGTLVTSITGVGQVSASNQIDLKPKVSGDIIYVGVTNGQTVGAGTLIAEIDPSDAQKSVRDAEANVQSAQISLKKLQEPADNLSLIQAQNALAQAKTILDKSYDDGFNSVSDAFLDLPTILTGLDDILYGTTLVRSQDNISAYVDMIKDYDGMSTTTAAFRDDVVAKYATARVAYTANLTDYKLASRTSATSTINNLIQETYTTTKVTADAIKSTNDFLNFVRDTLTVHDRNIPSVLSSAQNSLSTYTGQANSHLGDLLSIKNTIVSSEYSIAEKNESLAKLQGGPDNLDLESAQLSVTQRQNALYDAKEKLSDYFIRAPFAGTIAQIDVKKSDSVSSGTTVATLITAQKIAEISLNEVDVSKVRVGNKATLTFDAIDGLSITGQVSEIDSIGTVSQGVVSYNVKISFDTQDDRIKPGMSVSAAIVTAVKTDTIIVPSAAVKTQGGASFVELFDPPLAGSDGNNQGVPSTRSPAQIPVEIGLSNDTQTEIVSGISERAQVVVRTITSATKTTATAAPSLFGGTGVRTGGATGGVRVQTR